MKHWITCSSNFVSWSSIGILSTYFALETTFPYVVICYGGSFLLSCGICYTPPLANINKVSHKTRPSLLNWDICILNRRSNLSNQCILIAKWFPDRKGLVTGIVGKVRPEMIARFSICDQMCFKPKAAAMASAPTVWTPLITAYVNPNNISPDENGWEA